MVTSVSGWILHLSEFTLFGTVNLAACHKAILAYASLYHSEVLKSEDF